MRKIKIFIMHVGLIALTVGCGRQVAYEEKGLQTRPIAQATVAPESNVVTEELVVEYVSAEAKAAIEAPVSEIADTGKWIFQNSTDQMTDRKIRKGLVLSRDQMQFAPPYNGGGHAALMVRDHPRLGLNVVVSVNKGQFNCSPVSGCHVNMRFDDAKSMQVRAEIPSSGSVTTLFLTPEKKLLSLIQKSQVVRVEADFFRDGTRVMVFDTAKFKWPS